VLRIAQVEEIAHITGEDSANRTGTRFGVYGTDLGILWDNGRGEILVAFGDSYGEAWGGNGAGPGTADWRCNILAKSTTRDLSQGIDLDLVIKRPDGTAGQMLDRDTEITKEATIIPTSGIAVGDRNYLHYMSVRQWDQPGHWRTNYGGIAVSDDYGHTWSKPREARWINRRRRDNPFQMGAFARRDDHIYLVGTQNGRHGSASLARVAAGSVSSVDRYEYWTGQRWTGEDEYKARPVFQGPVGELSIQWHRYLGMWVAQYLDEPRKAMVLRTAEDLRGPWTEPIEVVSGLKYRGLYGGYIHPWAMDRNELYFLQSQWGPYKVTLMKATLEN
jgi:hypothetical protein